MDLFQKLTIGSAFLVGIANLLGTLVDYLRYREERYRGKHR